MALLRMVNLFDRSCTEAAMQNSTGSEIRRPVKADIGVGLAKTDQSSRIELVTYRPYDPSSEAFVHADLDAG
jgi:hypothetical protein